MTDALHNNFYDYDDNFYLREDRGAAVWKGMLDEATKPYPSDLRLSPDDH